MKVTLSARAEKQLRRLAKLDQIAVAKKIRGINQGQHGFRTEKLKGYSDIFRIRVGDYRIVYKKKKRELCIVLIGHRRDIYGLVRRLIK
jgi:mRNA interferase RelE/StbE